MLVTASAGLAERVAAALERRVSPTKHSERVSTALAGRQSGTVLVDDLDAGLAVVNAYAAEHLEIQTRDAASVAARVRNAGAVFVGPYSPVSLGDYAAGSNHVLPTGGCAATAAACPCSRSCAASTSSPTTRPPCGRSGAHVVTLAQAEDLPAHGEAVTARFGDAL